MKYITLNATCSYDVEITVSVPDEAYQQMCVICDKGISASEYDSRYTRAVDFLRFNVKPRDAINSEYRINRIIETDD